jgi:thiamine biosynthesis lipoprotein
VPVGIETSTGSPLAEWQRVEYQGTGLGTKIQLVAYTTERLDRHVIESAFQSALVEMQRLETLLSEWRADSDVGRVNAHAGQFVSISAETAFVIAQSQWSARLSDGAFDISFHSLGHLWKFGDARDASPRPPAQSDVVQALSRVDYRQIELDVPGNRVRIGVGQQVGLGGAAKGYIVDCMATTLLRGGVTDFLVQAGGDLFAAGTKPGGAAWEAGVQDPRAPWGTSFARIQLRDHAFSTAGDYARAYIYEGKRYHHIIDPRTGYPSTASRSVTIWAKTGVLADVLDDAVFILGPEKGLELVESLDDVGAIIVDGKNRVWISRLLRDKLKISHMPSAGL